MRLMLFITNICYTHSRKVEVYKMKIKANDYTKGEIIKILREWTGLTQEQFGKSIGKSAPSIQAYELDKVNYGIETLLQIAKKYCITITIEKK